MEHTTPVVTDRDFDAIEERYRHIAYLPVSQLAIATIAHSCNTDKEVQSILGKINFEAVVIECDADARRIAEHKQTTEKIEFLKGTCQLTKFLMEQPIP